MGHHIQLVILLSKPPSTLRHRALKAEAAQSRFFKVSWVPFSLLRLGGHHSTALFLAPRDPTIRVRAVAPGTRLIDCRSKLLSLRALNNSVTIVPCHGDHSLPLAEVPAVVQPYH